MKRTIKHFSLLLIFTLTLIGCSSNNSNIKKQITGKWESILVYPNVRYMIMADFEKDKDGKINVKLTSPRQKVFNLNVDSLKIDGNEISFSLTKFQIHYKGEYVADSNKIVGTWHQTKFNLPVVFFRQGELARLNRPQYPMKPFPYKVDSVTYKNQKDNIVLAGTITYPNDGKKYPGVLLLSGMGPQDRDETMYGHKPFVILSDFLTRQGYAVLRVDDRGIGLSTGKYYSSTTKDFASDAEAGLKFMKNQKMIDSSQIGLIGFNEGGLVASMVAAKSNDINYTVLLSTPGVSGENILLSQLYGATQKDDSLKQQRIRIYNLNKKIFKIIKNNPDSAIAFNKLKKAYNKFESGFGNKKQQQKMFPQRVIKRQINFMLSPWFRYYLTYNPENTFSKVKCPVLILFGQKDVQVAPEENLKAIEAALKIGGNNNVKGEILPELNHLFQKCKTGMPQEYAEIKQTFSPKAMQIILDWIQKQNKTKNENQVASK